MGFSHIYNLAALDHILFLVALCALFSLSEWKRLLVLITAFTIGHSITLALVSLDLIRINLKLVEFLIPITIMIAALFNFYTLNKKREGPTTRRFVPYLMAMVFGWIHGMGFSNYLRSTLFPGESLITQLLAFNLGIELGQILIVGKILALGYIFTHVFKIKFKHWAFTLSGLAFAVSLYLLIAKL